MTWDDGCPRRVQGRRLIGTDELTSRKSSAVVVDDEQALDPAWLSYTTNSKPDKAAIKEALKAGQQITGAQLLSRHSWRIC
jgi:Siphovirus Gp157